MVVANLSCPPIFLTELFPFQYTVSFIKYESLKPVFDGLVLKQLDKLCIEEKLWGNDNNVYSICRESLRVILAFFCMLILYVTIISTSDTCPL